MTKRPTEADYEGMAASYEADPPREDEMLSVEITPALRMGRPTKGTKSAGKTPAVSVRLPDPIRVEVTGRIRAGEASNESELIRRAVTEYLGTVSVFVLYDKSGGKVLAVYRTAESAEKAQADTETGQIFQVCMGR